MSNFSSFIGPSYRSLSKYAAVERCVNWFVEVIEDPDETKTKSVLYPTPCTGSLGPDFTGSVYGHNSRGLLELNGRLFGVNGSTFFEYTLPSTATPAGFVIQWGVVAVDSNPVTMEANGVISPGEQQIFITSADRGYIFNIKTNVFTALNETTNSFIGGRGGTFLDDFFITLIPDTNGIQVSNQNDGIRWSTVLGRSVAYAQGQSDIFSALISNQEYLYLFGKRRSEVWYNNGGIQFPFSIQPGAFIEMGIGGQFALAKADNTIFFLGQDSRGGRSIYKLAGTTPIRVSNFAVDTDLASFPTVADCNMYAFTWRGHIFVRCIFPSGGKGWTYDVTVSRLKGYSVWHENTFTDTSGNFFAPLERSHAYVQGIHVVGSGGVEGKPGTLYQFTDRTIISDNPVLSLRYSNNGGNTFNPEREVPVGKVGQYDFRVIADLLGSGRDRVFWVRAIDYGDAGGNNPITRDRIAPHVWSENRRIFYSRLELEVNKGIGAIALD